MLRVKVAPEHCSARCCGCLPHYFCPTARVVLRILGKRDGVKLSSVFIAPLHYPVDRGRRKDLCRVTDLFEDERLLWDSYSLMWNKILVAPHLCTCRRAPHLLKLDPTLELHGLPLRGKSPKCRQAASQIYHSPLKQKVKLSRFKATTCRPYNQLFLLFWIILCFSCSFPVIFFCLLCLFVLFLFPLSLVLSVIYPSCLTDISGFGVVLNRGESNEQ